MIEIKTEKIKNLSGICIENEYIKLILLPMLGGKTASLLYKPANFELAAQTGYDEYKIPKRDTRFDMCDASGWDDAFPTIDPSYDKSSFFSYTDHGEIWRSKFDMQKEKNGITLTYQSSENPFLFQKKISLSDSKVIYSYEISNTGTKDFPCFYTWHGLFTYEEDMRLIYPKDTKEILNVFDSKELGKQGLKYKFTNVKYDFTRVPEASSLSAIKYYLNEKVSEGVCAYEYPQKAVRVTMNFDHQVLPYLGMWITAGGFRKDYNCAFEPSSGFYDGILTAGKNGALWNLKPGEKKMFDISVACETITREEL